MIYFYEVNKFLSYCRSDSKTRKISVWDDLEEDQIEPEPDLRIKKTVSRNASSMTKTSEVAKAVLCSFSLLAVIKICAQLCAYFFDIISKLRWITKITIAIIPDEKLENTSQNYDTFCLVFS